MWSIEECSAASCGMDEGALLVGCKCTVFLFNNGLRRRFFLCWPVLSMVLETAVAFVRQSLARSFIDLPFLQSGQGWLFLAGELSCGFLQLLSGCLKWSVGEEMREIYVSSIVWSSLLETQQIVSQQFNVLLTACTGQSVQWLFNTLIRMVLMCFLSEKTPLNFSFRKTIAS